MQLRYVFYGDDFTGSTDVLEQLATHGVESVLFLAPPTEQMLAQFANVTAIGIAGDSRSRPPQWMTAQLPHIYEKLRSFGAPIVHYKVCSTFDSSPMHGSIGRAIELALPVFDPLFVPIVVGAPHLRRFVIEGELFAAAPDGSMLRIDRHPMSRHPVTPMREANLQLHLTLQTSLPIGHISGRSLDTMKSAAHALNAQLDAGTRIMLFDTTNREMLRNIGMLVWQHALKRPLFSASSSGLTSALMQAWQAEGFLLEPASVAPPTPVSPLLVISGSCSIMTARQVEWALAHGFIGVSIDPLLLLESSPGSQLYRNEIRNRVLEHLHQQHDTVIYTALGTATGLACGEALGKTLGVLLRDLLKASAIQRVVLCGGDTSSQAVQQLGLAALRWGTTLQPGAPLCRAYSAKLGARLLELILKGGQVGTEDFLVQATGR